VIHSLNPASGPEESKSAAAKPQADKSSGATGYARVHAAAVATGQTTTPKRERMTVPDGEMWEATKPGSHYALITGGPRKGLYINLTHGSRRGETFKIEQRGGDTLHVYTKTGKEVLVKAATDASDVTKAAKHRKPPHDQPPKGEKSELVAGGNYADIIGGPRNGLFVNISGGVRDGMAFQIVKKGGKWFHVYGTGKDRQWIPSDGPKHKVAGAQSSTASGTHSGTTSGSQSSTASTGGTAPASGA
jgi:hypothetical protein